MTERTSIRIRAKELHPGDLLDIGGNTYAVHRIDEPSGFVTIELDHQGGYFPAGTLTLQANPNLDIER